MRKENKNFRPQQKESYSEALVGKLPPQALELEEAVLGVLMLEKDKFYEVNRILPLPECFYKSEHSPIYEAVINLHRQSVPVDLLTITEELRKIGKLEQVGGAYNLTRLTMNVVTGAHVEAHALIIAEKWMKRKQIAVAGKMFQDAYDESVDVFDSLDESMLALQAITDGNSDTNSKTLEEVYKETLTDIEIARNKGMEIVGAVTGFKRLDELMNGFRKGKLIIVAARPAVGKTAFALQIAESLSADKERCDSVAYFSMEVKDKQLVQRTMSRINHVFMGNISKPSRLSDTDFKKLIDGAHKIPLRRFYINHQASLTWIQLRNEVRRLVFQNDVSHVFIDYLQLMSGDKSGSRSNREQEISTISRELKKMAMEFDICVVALSQMSRSVETRADPTPKLSDLRESGAIEQDADVVCFLYGATEDDIKRNPFMANERILSIAKNRDGEVGLVDLKWNGGLQTFTEVIMEDFAPLSPQAPDNPFAGMPHAPNNGSKMFIENGAQEKDDLPF